MVKFLQTFTKTVVKICKYNSITFLLGILGEISQTFSTLCFLSCLTDLTFKKDSISGTLLLIL